ncbi:MAG: hypothetical protein ASARMPRED_006638 [Alectoria sarmentosa]|nr:MAG: hypothetical protein ASARMPRED_006638 [Alectoria sarmentosa]
MSVSPACSQAVALPEIVAAILDQLHGAKALFAALLVNRLWAAEATRLLWRVDPPVMALAHIKDAKRLQYYADKITSLDLLGGKDGWKSRFILQGLRFPRLNQVIMKAPSSKDEQMFLQYLQPELRILQCGRGPVSDFYLMQIQGRCPALRSLSLRCQLSTITGNGLLQFLNGMPSLTTIRLGGRWKCTISDEVFFHLASRPNLDTLQISAQNITPNLIKRMQKAVDQPFPGLSHLSCFSQSEAFRQFSRHLSKLTNLHLDLLDIASNTFHDLCSCTSLVSLALDFSYCSRFDANSHIPPEGLLALAKSCTHLQSLSVMHSSLSEPNDSGITNITDDVIKEFVALLPGLSCFRLRIKTNLTHRVLRVLGEGCADLKICSIDGKHLDLRLLGGDGPVLFPQLVCLEIESTEESLSAAMAAEILHHHAPRVNRLGFGKSRRFDWEFYEKMQELERRDEARSLDQIL